MAVAAQMVIDMSTDVSDATAGFDKVASEAKAMANDVEASGRAAARGLDGLASSADDLGGKAGRATGALGALSSGAELGGPAFEKYGTALQTAALATDFASGVGDAFNLVLESTILQNARARVATIAKTVAEKSAAVATKAMTAGQWALNAALNANPIGLIVLAIAALVAGLILAYKKSETFRNIVQAVGRVGQEALGWVVDKIQAVIDIAGRLIGWFKDKIPAAIGTMKDKVGDVIDVLLTPFRTLQDIIEKILDLIGKIKLPDLPDLNPFSRGVATGTTVSAAAPVLVEVRVDATGALILDTERQLIDRVTVGVQRALSQVGIR